MKRHLTFALVCLFGISAVVFACKSGDVLPDLPSDHYILTQGTLFPTKAGINVVTDTVNISICPYNADCFAPDNASASIRLIQNSETRSVRLFTFIEDGVKRRPLASINDSTSVRFGNQLYKVILKARHTKARRDVNTFNEEGAGQAILQVSKL